MWRRDCQRRNDMFAVVKGSKIVTNRNGWGICSLHFLAHVPAYKNLCLAVVAVAPPSCWGKQVGLATRDARYAGNANRSRKTKKSVMPGRHSSFVVQAWQVQSLAVDGNGGSSHFNSNDMPPVAERDAFQRRVERRRRGRTQGG